MSFDPGSLKSVRWIGSTREDVASFPKKARRVIGQALLYAQAGMIHPDARPMIGTLKDVTEIRVSSESEAYRVMYTAKLGGVIYALHAFHKKSTVGIKTPRRHLKLIAQRLTIAREDNAKNSKKK